MTERRFAHKTAIITGGSRGLGAALAERFLAEGANVAICARETEVLERTATQLQEGLGSSEARLLAMPADVSNEAEVAGFVRAVQSRFQTIDALVCNAGVHGPIGAFADAPWADWVRAVEVNLFGVALICRAVLPVMKRQGSGRIVALSGGGATQPRPGFSAYAASKAAVVRFVETLAVELEEAGVEINAVAPGALNTRLLDQVLEAGAERLGAEEYAKAVSQRDSGETSFAPALDAITFLASDDSRGISGRLIAARWDAWSELAQQRERLAGSDVYTLRRIVPEDRHW